MTLKIDSVDQAIIRLLMEDGRMAVADIARRIPCASERSLHYRIDRLIQRSVIRLSAIVDPRAVGFSVIAEVLIRVEPGHIQAVAEGLAELERVSYVSCALGHHDVGITMHARDNTELYTMVTRDVASMSGVQETTIALVPLLLKDVYHWQIPNSEIPCDIPPRIPPYYPSQIAVHKIDRVDQAIVHLLMEDARMPAAQIARRIKGVTPRAVSDCIDALIEQAVMHVTAIVNPEKVGFPIRADIYIEVESTHVLDVAQRLAELEETSWVACAIGESDLSIQICVRDTKELYRFVTEVIHNVSGITRTSTTLVSRVFKDSYDWRIPDSVTER